jgi:hypothetical protein
MVYRVRVQSQAAHNVIAVVEVKVGPVNDVVHQGGRKFVLYEDAANSMGILGQSCSIDGLRLLPPRI